MELYLKNKAWFAIKNYTKISNPLMKQYNAISFDLILDKQSLRL